MLTQQVVAHTVVEAHRPDLVISFICVGGFGEACMCIVCVCVACVWMEGLFLCISMRRLRACGRLFVVFPKCAGLCIRTCACVCLVYAGGWFCVRIFFYLWCEICINVFVFMEMIFHNSSSFSFFPLF